LDGSEKYGEECKRKFERLLSPRSTRKMSHVHPASCTDAESLGAEVEDGYSEDKQLLCGDCGATGAFWLCCGCAKRRDTILRAFILGKDWDTNDEFILKRRLVRQSRHMPQGALLEQQNIHTLLLEPFPYLVDDEWEAEQDAAQHL
jgi:hypothetical protein